MVTAGIFPFKENSHGRAGNRNPDPMIEEDVVPGGALNLKSTNLPRPWSPREFSPSRKIPKVEPGIELGTP